MEYAIIEIGGHQFWIEKGQYLIINKVSISKKAQITCGSNININRILLINKNNNIYFGYPYLLDSLVQGQILEYLQGSKITIYKMKSKKKYRRKKGHRQELTKLIITKIEN
jgi:large subunit ribosomal protein L21